MDVTRRNFIVSTTAAAAGATLTAQASGVGAQTPALVAQAVGRPAPRGFDPADPALTFDLVATADAADGSVIGLHADTHNVHLARTP